MKRMIWLATLLTTGSLLLLTPSGTYAENGKNIFLNRCGSCHRNGGGATVFAPTKYASSQWERFFARNKHARKKDISTNFSASELNAVKDYLVSHAADSDQPEAIGLR